MSMGSEEVCIVENPDQFADFVMDELGRWAAEECPIMFKGRPVKTDIFSGVLYEEDLKASSLSPMQIKFAKNGFVVVKIAPTNNYDDIKFVRLAIADPALRDKIASCAAKIIMNDFSDFVSLKEAQIAWRS